jgi:4-nitrophenyl phosphatase
VTEQRQRVALMLVRRGAALVGICADRVYPSPRGLEFGSGAHTTMLGYAAGVQAVFVGKPEPLFFRKLCQKLGVQAHSCILIGDNIESDVVGAKALGMKTILVLTGVVGRGDLGGILPEHQPDIVLEDLRQLF